MTTRLDQSDLPDLLAEAVGATPTPPDHARLQTRGRRRRRVRQVTTTAGSIGAVAVLVVTAPLVLPPSDMPLIGGGPAPTETPEPLDQDDTPNVEIVHGGCPDPIGATWTCLEVDERPQAPEPALEALDSEAPELASLQGQTVVVTIWAEWCGPCATQQADLTTVQTSREDVAFLGIATETVEDDAAAFVATHRIGYPTLLDPTGNYTRTLNEILDNEPASTDQAAIPATLLVDRDGRIAAWTTGQTNRGELEVAISHATG